MTKQGKMEVSSRVSSVLLQIVDSPISILIQILRKSFLGELTMVLESTIRLILAGPLLRPVIIKLHLLQEFVPVLLLIRL